MCARIGRCHGDENTLPHSSKVSLPTTVPYFLFHFAFSQLVSMRAPSLPLPTCWHAGKLCSVCRFPRYNRYIPRYNQYSPSCDYAINGAPIQLSPMGDISVVKKKKTWSNRSRAKSGYVISGLDCTLQKLRGPVSQNIY